MVTNYPLSQLVDVICSGEHFNQDQLHFGVIMVLYQVDLLIQSGKHTLLVSDNPITAVAPPII